MVASLIRIIIILRVSSLLQKLDSPEAALKELEKLTPQALRDKEPSPSEKARKEHKIQQIRQQEKQISEELEKREQERKQKQVLTKEIIEEKQEEPAPVNFMERLRRGIGKTRDSFMQGLGNIVLGKKEIDDDVLDELEEVLISADIGPETTYRILKAITQKVERKELQSPDSLKDSIKEEIFKIMSKTYPKKDASSLKPKVYLFVGVNGVGKTTTIGKLASQYQKQGKKVLLGAGDTFRAAAIEQLTEWSKRSQCDIIAKSAGSDPSSVMFESVEKAVKENYDVVICDTAGRLHTKQNLMEELKKMIRVIKKVIPDAPHEVLLVLDATTGQNAIFQTREFREVAPLTGLVITKLDGTAKGGVVIGIVNEFDVPVRYIGVGESIEDLREFDPQAFTESLFF
ncbi:MAG: signal recognition particle-docking protein FtsY [SAR324 cluster bacterium]|nr:signal recognition particle-docking protein FtsY [SAR324 cluster bacterium]